MTPIFVVDQHDGSEPQRFNDAKSALDHGTGLAMLPHQTSYEVYLGRLLCNMHIEWADDYKRVSITPAHTVMNGHD